MHMSEEVRRAKQAVSRSMFYTIGLNGILAYGIIIVILYTMGSLDDALNSSFPIIEICQGAIASVSCLTWAWARDGALPIWFAHVGSFRSRLT